MFERYTERARRVLFFSRYEAVRCGSASIESEHILLGLIREGKSLTSRILARWNVSLPSLRAEVQDRVPLLEKRSAAVEIPFSAETKRILLLAAEEADLLLHNYIGTEHLLLGLLREEQSAAASILMGRGLRLQAVRDTIQELLVQKAPLRPPEHIVLVQVTIRPEMLGEFEQALLHNARESIRFDPGCLRFDVSQDRDDPARWVLHEVYTNPDAHAAHRQSPHFLAYDEVASRAVVDKTVLRGVGKHIVP